MKQPQPPYDDAQLSAVVTRHCAEKGYIVDGPEADKHGYLNFEVSIPGRCSGVRISLNGEVFTCPFQRATAGPSSLNTQKTRQRSSQPSWPSWTLMPIPPRVKSRSSDECAAHGSNCMSATAQCCVGEGGARVLLILRRAERTIGHAADTASSVTVHSSAVPAPTPAPTAGSV